MKILIVASYNKNRFAPFIVEQVEALQAAGCEVEWFGVQKKGLLGYLQEIPRLHRMIEEWQPDVIHAHYGLSGLLANIATRRVPVVSTYHGSDINLATVRPLSRIAIWLSAWNIFVNKRAMALVGAEEGKKCSLIPCGVVLGESRESRAKSREPRAESRESRAESREVRVLFSGAFDNPVKDPELAKLAVEELRAKSRELRAYGVQCTVYGVQGKDLRSVELIELKGYTREEVNRLMCEVDCLLMTSKTEGSPQVIKEAMACGCPIVSVDVGDVAERVEEVEGCFVVKSREPRAIAEALKKAIAFEGKTNGREKIIADGLTNEDVAKRIIEIYNKLRAKS